MAIDEKSPYTGGHRQRVPALTMMLAEARTTPARGRSPISHERQGPLRTEDRWPLHDCGKVTTPVHVVDKATKLQTIYDRIHLVDTRFEVLRRDAEIESLRAVIDGEGARSPRHRLAERLRQLDDDRAFLRRCNIGGEPMKPEDQERVRRISRQYRWVTSDVRKGALSISLTAEELENPGPFAPAR